MKRLLNITLLLSSAAILSLQTGCTATGAAVGAGAAVGVGAAREGGLRSTTADFKIKALISDKWFKYNIETFAKLNLTVNQGRVLITGVVQSPDDRVEAVRLAWQVEGVQQVINEIQIAESAGFKSYVRDQWITAQLRTKLTFDRDVQSINYSIDTVRGVIYLMGVGQHRKEINKVIEIARTVPHVNQVISYVKIVGSGPNAETENSEVMRGEYEAAPEKTTENTDYIEWNDGEGADPSSAANAGAVDGTPAKLTPVTADAPQ